MLPYLLLKIKRYNSEGGFTIIESLLAVLLIAIVLVGIGPIIAFSTATRIQSRRVEIGIQSARGYLSGVQSGTIPHPPIAYSDNNPVALKVGDVDPPPSATLNCPTGNAYCTAPVDNEKFALYCVDIDDIAGCNANSQKDLVIQAFGLQAPPASGTMEPSFPLKTENNEIKNKSLERPNAGYQLGIRVYRANSFGQNITLQKSGTAGRANSQARTVTSGIGSRALPIVEMTTEVVQAKGEGTTLTDLCRRINRTQSGDCN
ncbi:hormogonium polysaccharide secretion pseudopilin HpsB [Spirulina sp. CCNP1310]|uniref:hormogonium polysaccharide secretion pseudopilin HpsB n=1 Tax=Spirulina sp. CCNP1310 TaxID=3110249 RepID=UPI002B21B96B|nr:hormogonium polysaccharide secretion pseudopilin HpsB [Spirulina sp. CCNP1310]MEA5419093.1 hormogonium polysaccharide secretion pseudopilin HpsB [Spirulina sp. CCNP1310]